MLEYSELTVYKNASGLTSALGFPINSFLLQNNKPLFVGGGKKKKTDQDELEYEHLAVPAGLVCITQTVCRSANEIGANEIGANEMGANANDAYSMDEDAIDAYSEDEIVPDGLYERLLELAETKPMKKMTKRKQQHKHKKTHKTKK